MKSMHIAKSILSIALAFGGVSLTGTLSAEVDCLTVPGCVVPVSSSPNKSSFSDTFSTALAVPYDSEHRTYLGIDDGRETFKMSDIRADILVVLVFDMYCHVCGQSADNMSRLEEKLNGKTDDCRVRIIGLGRGDTQFEVETFARKFKLDFPVFSDRKHGLSDGLGVTRTPSGFAFICDANGGFELVDSFSGYLSKLKLEAFTNRVGALCSKE